MVELTAGFVLEGARGRYCARGSSSYEEYWKECQYLLAIASNERNDGSGKAVVRAERARVGWWIRVSGERK